MGWGDVSHPPQRLPVATFITTAASISTIIIGGRSISPRKIVTRKSTYTNVAAATGTNPASSSTRAKRVEAS
jgi:hypothetical protein